MSHYAGYYNTGDEGYIDADGYVLSWDEPTT